MFGHGRLRLYLLKLLDERPRHGYQLIRLLEQRFHGRYAPSAGTVYPRLQRLDAAGLVRHTAAGGRKTYEITDAGRAELRERAAELVALEADITASVQRLPEAADPPAGDRPPRPAELRAATRRDRAARRGGWAPPWTGPPPPSSGGPPPGPSAGSGALERRLAAFTAEVRGLADGVRLTEEQLRAAEETLAAAGERLRHLLRG